MGVYLCINREGLTSPCDWSVSDRLIDHQLASQTLMHSIVLASVVSQTGCPASPPFALLKKITTTIICFYIVEKLYWTGKGSRLELRHRELSSQSCTQLFWTANKSRASLVEVIHFSFESGLPQGAYQITFVSKHPKGNN